uniref:Single-strand selective monofunctional uracil-DNA glycosylase-like n=1 Tax=Hirondellea gigas TaxID=1518452 RepID=A0A6A7G791_9CRUS
MAAAVGNPVSDILLIEQELSAELMTLSYAPKVKYLYNPIHYAVVPHLQYLQMFCSQLPKPLMMLGMNPGPWGMAQTGVPFGHVNTVRDWLGIQGEVSKPASEHPKKPVQGFLCTRSEVSGERLWGLLKQLSGGDASTLAASVLLYNYCPLMMLADSGANITPADLKAGERKELESACNSSLVRTVSLLGVQDIIAVGNYTYDRTRAALKQSLPHVKVHKLLHPSPRSPAANRDWAGAAYLQLRNADLLRYFDVHN